MPFRLSGGNDAAGLALLSGMLSAPEVLNNQRIEASQMRGLLRQMGTPEDYINLYAPGEDTPSPVGGTGIAGKILSGVGKTGAVLSTMLGAPIKAPRVTLGEAGTAAEQGYREQLAGMETDPKKKALIRLGRFDDAYSGAGGPKTPFQLAMEEAKRRGLSG